jgi:hypothetical protein
MNPYYLGEPIRATQVPKTDHIDMLVWREYFFRYTVPAAEQELANPNY